MVASYLRSAFFLCLCAAVGLTGCEPIQSDAYHDFEDDDPSARLAAITRAGRTRDEQAIPYLVDRLTVSEPEVRFFAIVALRKITGRTLGYRYYQPRHLREEAVLEWRRWLKEHGKASTQPKHTEQPAQS